MATVKHRLTKLEDLIAGLRASTCPSCGGFGHNRRFVIPYIGAGSGDVRWARDQIPVPDDRIDADGRCVLCGAPPALPSIVSLESPPELERMHRRSLNG